MATRRHILKSLSLTGVLSSLGFSFKSLAEKEKPTFKSTFSTGTEDRLFWANLLYKIAYPVVHNLAEGTLTANMPLEIAPNYFLKLKKVTYLEAVGRTVAGVAPWLALPDDETKEGALRKQLRTDLLRGIGEQARRFAIDQFDSLDIADRVLSAYESHVDLRKVKI